MAPPLAPAGDLAPMVSSASPTPRIGDSSLSSPPPRESGEGAEASSPKLSDEGCAHEEPHEAPGNRSKGVEPVDVSSSTPANTPPQAEGSAVRPDSGRP